MRSAVKMKGDYYETHRRRMCMKILEMRGTLEKCETMLQF